MHLLLAKEIQLFPCLGLYSGIFAIYFQCPSNKTRTANIIFYIICLLYVLCAATVVSDLLDIILRVSNRFIIKNIILSSVVQSIINSLSPRLQIDFQPILIRIADVQLTVNACCDFTSQCIIVRINHSTRCCIYHLFYLPKSSKIYRCWIVWGQSICMVIIPSFLAITALGQTINLHLILIS